VYGGDVASDLGADASVVQASTAVLRGESGPVPAFLVVHLLGVDELGHAYGGRSEQYDEGTANVDALLKKITGALTSARQTLVVTGRPRPPRPRGSRRLGARGRPHAARPLGQRDRPTADRWEGARGDLAGRRRATLAVLPGVGVPAEAVPPRFAALRSTRRLGPRRDADRASRPRSPT
jgi:hypothetical protein